MTCAMHELAQDTSGAFVSARLERDTQCIVHHDLFNSDGVLSMGCVYSLQLDWNAKPFALPACSVSPALVDKIQTELQCMKYLMVLFRIWKGAHPQ